MSLTTGQMSKIRKQEGFKWLKMRGDRDEAVDQTLIYTKVTSAIDVALGSGRATDAAIRQVASAAGTPWGDTHENPMIYIGKCSIHAKTEIVLGKDKHLAQALRMVFGGTATGRSGPKSGTINHIHVGGGGSRNIIFDTSNSVVLGVVNFHMDSEMRGGERNEVAKVEGRAGSATQEVFVQDDRIY